MLTVSDVSLQFAGDLLYKHVDLIFQRGHCYGIIGANGAGKSTTLKAVSGLMRAKTGQIRFEERDIGATAPNKIVSLGLAHVPEGRRVFAQMTVEENLEMGAFTQPKAGVSASLENVYSRRYS